MPSHAAALNVSIHWREIRNPEINQHMKYGVWDKSDIIKNKLYSCVSLSMTIFATYKTTGLVRLFVISLQSSWDGWRIEDHANCFTITNCLNSSSYSQSLTWWKDALLLHIYQFLMGTTLLHHPYAAKLCMCFHLSGLQFGWSHRKEQQCYWLFRTGN